MQLPHRICMSFNGGTAGRSARQSLKAKGSRASEQIKAARTCNIGRQPVK
jgi:hypothetical protein